MKRSAHRAVLAGLGLSEERSIYLERFGHLGQLDPLLSLRLAREKGLLKEGSLVALAAAGVGYFYGAAVLRLEGGLDA